MTVKIGYRLPDVFAGVTRKKSSFPVQYRGANIPQSWAAGSIVVDQYLQVLDHPGIYAVGDNAHVVDVRTHQPVPLLAQAAVQEGAAVARNLARAVQGKPQAPFQYRSLGNAGSLGLSSGALEVGGLVLNGRIGWLGWRLVHLARMTSLRDKLATAMDWSLGYVYDLDTARLDLKAANPSAAGRAEQGA